MYLDFKMDKNKTVASTIPSTFIGYIYMFKDGAETVKIQTKDEDAHFVFIAGEPLRKSIVQHGPFVMNTQEETHDTFVDYQSNQNGFERARNWRSAIA
ncbi:hypothetical protein BGX24_004284 [Mortierella sp. AD032]|nr:hypothetical protein BGX24_004284 [Mortierella sp. AD032]